MFDVLVIGGGAAGMSCALVLGSAKKQAFAADKNMGIILHQKTSHLQTALFNNVLGFHPGTTGQSIMDSGRAQLKSVYPHVTCIENEKVKSLSKTDNGFLVATNKKEYSAKIVVIAVGYSDLITISGLDTYIELHPRAKIEKARIWLKNDDHLIEEGMYVAGTLAGWRSQYAIAAGSGAHVATDILTLWNNGQHVKVHDKI
ncbi:FAD-dependent oxidoreductase [Bizionia myxarmorum]|uniref:NAD(P)/FAD-dependent oxidoreductase n=1 Tax=Bizionia myxarmorum TaxID=291186 RepID=A0A5D0RAI0_9FLAO|nr:FAD-dependent oxidoreductase [Bizionia myxarmorum]TYB78497.1 NAD(P)/FAD-dependent oxidoreductase [Bizionia myxarmorum]